MDASVPVLIVGGGPIGLGLAADLGRRGVRALLVEKRPDRLGSAKMIQVSVRTMEFCRQLGISETIWNWGFPHDHNLDSVFVTTLTGYELGRVRTSTMAEERHSPWSPERDVHCPQTWFDPILQRHARSFSHVELRYETELETFEQDADGVTAVVVNRRDGNRSRIRCAFLVGADGYGSRVRQLLGIAMRGRPHLDLSMSVYVTIPALHGRHDKGPAYRYLFIDDEGTWGVLTTIDGRDFYRLQLIGSDERDVRAIDLAAAMRRGIGVDVPYTVDDVSLWERKMVVADRFADGRVFLAGDAAHAHPPNGGLGMNTGMQDAFDLGWKLAGTLAGWGGPALLASYDVERRPASARAAEESLRNYHRLTADTRYPGITRPTAEGAALRAALGARLVAENEKAWHPIGVHLGYLYAPSPIVEPDDAPLPSDDTIAYAPSTVPGARAPHAWIDERTSTLDLFGDGFALLAFGAAVDPQPLAVAAASRGVPLRTRRIDDAAIAALYERRLVLVRPDGHVAWRGDALPERPDALIDTVRGAGLPVAARRGGAGERGAVPARGA